MQTLNVESSNGNHTCTHACGAELKVAAESEETDQKIMPFR